MNEDGVEEVKGEAEAVAVEPGDKGSSGGEGGGVGGEGFEEGVPERGRNGTVGFGEAELDGVEMGGRGGVRSRRRRRRVGGLSGKEVNERGEVVAA